jgi:23S rRNA (uridine2552-2'-O)-methyltransferase
MRLQEARRDLYRRLAKEQGYKSRAAFKLLEASDKYGFIREGDVVIDFGAAPGGWLQICSKLVGPRGLVVGLDLVEVRLAEANVRTLKLDVMDKSAEESLAALTRRRADVVLSDLSPSISGVWELDQGRQADLTLRVLELSVPLLRRGGCGFFKTFEGERSGEIRDALRGCFRAMRPLKPQASRSASSELYYYCEGWLGRTLQPGP